ncbi:MAG: methyltransferase domain-containing protein [Cryomorphaceae bacterium]|nr:methyltransferase domain-containing protein [Cryomorphaceae bacterium]
MNLQEKLGNIDIYLLDQLLKGTYNNCNSVLDVGCGSGRNLTYLAKVGKTISGIDRNEETAKLALKNISSIPDAKVGVFAQAEADDLPFEKETFDLVIANAMLHFAKDEAHFNAILDECFRVLKTGGYFFCRTASDIGIESLVKNQHERTFILPDGSTRFLVNLKILIDAELRLKAIPHEPIKTTNVQNLRCMTTWCLLKT